MLQQNQNQNVAREISTTKAEVTLNLFQYFLAWVIPQILFLHDTTPQGMSVLALSDT